MFILNTDFKLLRNDNHNSHLFECAKSLYLSSYLDAKNIRTTEVTFYTKRPDYHRERFEAKVRRGIVVNHKFHKGQNRECHNSSKAIMFF